jgi:hypothetical protein
VDMLSTISISGSFGAGISSFDGLIIYNLVRGFLKLIVTFLVYFSFD